MFFWIAGVDSEVICDNFLSQAQWSYVSTAVWKTQVWSSVVFCIIINERESSKDRN